MKTLIKKSADLFASGRWDIDFHLPPEGIKLFPKNILRRIDSIADFSKEKRDPTKKSEAPFRYIDISCVDPKIGLIQNPQDLIGEEAPSRARKVVSAFDLVISTCRPTRGAIAVVPLDLHNEIASTGFSVIRPHLDINPFYLHFALKLDSTLEQFRKWSTGSSYPAILDSDVAKTLIPVPDKETQDKIAELLMKELHSRHISIEKINVDWNKTIEKASIMAGRAHIATTILKSATEKDSWASEKNYKIQDVKKIRESLSPLTCDLRPVRKNKTTKK